MTTIPSALVDVAWLNDNFNNENLVILDASQLPVVPGYESLNAEDSFQAILTARRFDYDKNICKPDSSLPHMMPSAELFEAEVRKLGINSDSIIVVYDDVGIYASPRAWWMLRAMGHEQVAVLDGGLKAWIAAGHPTQAELSTEFEAGDFIAKEDTAAFCDFEVVLNALDDTSCCILDARSAGRFNGTAAEPRPGMRSGHMPNAKSLPFPQLLDGGVMKPIPELEKIFAELANHEQRIITSCGSGLTACILSFAAYLAGYHSLSVYDGSWSEWGMPSKLPVVVD